MKYIFLSFILVVVSLTAKSHEISGVWFGELNAGQSKINLIFNISEDNTGATVCTLDSPDQGVKNIPAQLSFLNSDSIKINIPSFGASYEGIITKDVITGKFSQAGFDFDLNLKPGKPVIKRTQNPQPPFEYQTEEVFFTNVKDNTVLSGTLTYPVAYDNMKKGKVPVVLMVSGSGLQNRDEEILDHKPFLVIADYLAKHGIASLRYDDRSVGKSTGNAANATTADFMEDAAAGLEYLKKTNKFGKTGVLGHSEGGIISFMLGSRKKADFIISLAGTGVRGDSVLVGQTKLSLLQSGMPEELCNDYCNVLEQAYQYKIAGTSNVKDDPDTIIDKIITGTKVNIPAGARNNIINILKLNNPWLDYFMSYSPANDISSTTCPVMALNGSLDIQVIAGTNLNAIKKLLPQNRNNLIKEYDGLNHLFQHCTTGNPTEYGRIEETISTDVLQDITEWIKSL